MRRATSVAIGVIVLALAAPGAWAAVTRTAVTVPAGRDAYVISNDVTLSTLAVAGTTNGTTGDLVDVRCYQRQATVALTPVTLVANVPVAADGSFATTVAHTDLTSVAANACLLRAIPAGASVSMPNVQFAGPRLLVSRVHRPSIVATGPSAGTPYDFQYDVAQRGGVQEIASESSCGETFSFLLLGSELVQPGELFGCDPLIDRSGPAGRSGLRIDGINALGPFEAQESNGTTAPGVPAVAVQAAIDAATGDATIAETDGIARCPGPNQTPFDAEICTAFLPLPVAFARRWLVTGDGRSARYTDTWRSTDAKPHQLDVYLEEDTLFPSAAVSWRLPWLGAGFRNLVANQDLAGPGPIPGAGYVLARDLAAADPDATVAAGAIVFSSPPNDVLVQGRGCCIWLHYVRTIPATGALTLRFANVQGMTSLDLDAAVRAELDRVAGPTVTILAPSGGRTVTHRTLVVRGLARDAVGVVRLTVGGHVVPVGAGGRWSTTLRLRPGPNAIAATARDAAGNVGTAVVTVRFRAVPCVVPALAGVRLARARARLVAAHCTAGRVRRVASATVPRGRVVRTRPPAGTRLPNDARVALVVSRGRG